MATDNVETVAVKTVTITMTEREAQVLRTLLGQCGFMGPTQPLYDALNEAGIKGGKFRVATPATGAITIEERA